MKHSILNKMNTKTAKREIQKKEKDKIHSSHEISQLMSFTNKIEPSSGGLHWTTVTSSHF
jgi:hypothetical protein